MQNKRVFFAIFCYLFLMLFCKPADAEKKGEPQEIKKQMDFSEYIDPTFTMKGNSIFEEKSIVFSAGFLGITKGLGLEYSELKNPNGWEPSEYCAEFDVKKNLLRMYFVKGVGHLNLAIVSRKGDFYYLLNEKKTKILRMKVIEERKKKDLSNETYLSREYFIVPINEYNLEMPLTIGYPSSKTYQECIDWYSEQYESAKNVDEQEPMTAEEAEEYRKKQNERK